MAKSFINYFLGSCYTDKLKVAIISITRQVDLLTKRMNEITECKNQIAFRIRHGGSNDLVFNIYDQCVININCKTKKVLWQLQQKKDYMEKELKLELEGFGDLQMTGNELLY